MKQFFLMLLLILIFSTGCKKENRITGNSTVTINTTTPVTNTAPVAFAGPDFYIVLPADSLTLKGAVSDTPSDDIVQHSWKKISGPSGGIIDNPALLQTKVRNLLKGTYQFELTVIDKGGLSGKDTVIVDVRDPINPGSGELIFTKLKWIYPWYAAVEVENMYSYPPPKKVFIKRGFDSVWVEVNDLSDLSTNNQYEYFIEKRPDGAGMYSYGSLYIFYYGSNTADTPDVKVRF